MENVVIHYDEIGIKGKNRPYFERLLIQNIRSKLKIKSAKREPGQITLKVDDTNKSRKILAKIPGIAYFSMAIRCNLTLDAIKKEVISILKNKKFSTFKINAERHDKNNKFRSMKLNQDLGGIVINKYKKKVKLKNPDITVKVEVSNKFAYISLENIKGVGGLPVNSKQKVISLLSGGFDSPVAAYMMMKRGCEVIFVHFNNKNQSSSSVKNKIIELVKSLSDFQIKSKLYIIPFEKIQKEIIIKVKASMRMLVYRRFMIKIAGKIADMEKAKFLVLGDSLSQVASQTIDNLSSTYADSDLPIFSPLIGMDKKEIINISRQIGIYEISALPYPDCCSYFIPKHPELKARLKDLSKFKIKDSLINDSIKNSKIIDM